MAVSKAGSVRKLAKMINVNKSILFNCQQGLVAVSEENLKKIENFISTTINEKDILIKLPANWRQSIGGKNCVKSKLAKNTLNSQLMMARRSLDLSGHNFSAWHKSMKKNNPQEYYQIQYTRFKKIGGYKYTAKGGEKVRNILEKNMADFFFDRKINYSYEPLININKHYFFPDFVVNDNVIECTMWRGYDKATKLAKKIKMLERKYKVFVLIPEKLHRYYKKIDKNLLFTCEEVGKAMFK